MSKRLRDDADHSTESEPKAARLEVGIPEAQLSQLSGVKLIGLDKLLDGNKEEKDELNKAISHISTVLDTEALRTTAIRFDISHCTTPEAKADDEKNLQALLQTDEYSEKDCRRGRALFVDPADDTKLVLMTYRLHRTTSIPQSPTLFVKSVNDFDESPSLENLKNFYFQALGLSLKKYVKDNQRALSPEGVTQEKLAGVFTKLKEMAGSGKEGTEYYKALLAADVLMQQGIPDAPVQPMYDFWQYAINAGVPMGRPEPVPGRTPTFSSVISVPGYNAVEVLHPAYGAQMMARLEEFIPAIEQVAVENGMTRPTVIDAGPCTGTILIPTAEMYRNIDFVAVEPDGPSCKILRQALKERGITNVKVIEKCMQDVSLEDDLRGVQICGMYSSFAAHHMPLPKVLAKLNEIGCSEYRAMITDEWTAPLGCEAAICKELMKYHLPIILERGKLTFDVNLDELKKSEHPRVSVEEINLIKDFNRDSTILYDLVCNNRDDAAKELLEKMKSYNERYADIFEKKSKTGDKTPLHPTVAILLFGIQEFGALHQGAIHYREEHKGPESGFVETAVRDFGMTHEGTMDVLGVAPKGRDEGGIKATILKGASLGKAVAA